MRSLSKCLQLTRRLIVGLISVLVSLSISFSPFGSSTSVAADLSSFDAGNIISDSNFFNGNALTASEIQNFLNSKVPNCTINNGQASHAAGAPFGSTFISDVCLKDYSQQTPTMAAQPGLCEAYSGSNRESAAQIIAKVGKACNISQKVLIVLLEKEQSLISDSWPTQRQINQATGFACYDNGQPCVQEYAGFFYQVWSAARQFQRYGNSPFTWYPVGQISNVLYQANRPDCGSKPVLISNRATAALYYYTPYTPNQAALNAGYGTGDSCSAYGNRNFYQLYVDWFGSTKGFDVLGQFALAYQNSGGSQGFLGVPLENKQCILRDGGCYQQFSGGIIVSGPNESAYSLKPEVWSTWNSSGSENGPLGFPTSSSNSQSSTYTQSFEGGSLSVTSAKVVPDYWTKVLISNAWLGKPIDSISHCVLPAGGCYQQFSNGIVIGSTAGGIHPLRSEVNTFWGQNGFQNGPLGYPTGDPSAAGNTYTQTFQGGAISVTNGIVEIDTWGSIVVNNSWLGTALDKSKQCVLPAGGCYQQFSNGIVIGSTAGGIHPLRSEVNKFWGQNGFQNGPLGYPTGDPSAAGNTYTQTFQGGTVTVTNGVTTLTNATDPWLQVVANNSWLGTALDKSKQCVLPAGGCYQQFSNGIVIGSTAGGIHPLRSEVNKFWGQNGFQNGPLGYPTGDPSAAGNTYTQTFQGGTVTVTNGVTTLTNATDPWLQVVANNSWLGTALDKSKQCVLPAGGCYQQFSNGIVIGSTAGGIHPLRSEVNKFWGQNGFQNGPLGYPTGDPSAAGNTYTQTFQGGTVTVTNGVTTLTNATDPWLQVVANNSWLGTALDKSKQCVLPAGGCYQQFSNGIVIGSTAGGIHPLRSEVNKFWGQNGFQNGPLGYPTGDPSAAGNTYTQTFQGGTVTVTNGVTTLTNATDPWLQVVANNSWLGTALDKSKQCVLPAGGCYQQFSNGIVIGSTAGGIHPLRSEVNKFWGQNGFQNGPLGYPTGDPSAAGNTYTQTFQGGTVTVTNGVTRRN